MIPILTPSFVEIPQRNANSSTCATVVKIANCWTIVVNDTIMFLKNRNFFIMIQYFFGNIKIFITIRFQGYDLYLTINNDKIRFFKI